MTCEVRNARPIGEFRWSLKSRPDNNAAGQIDVISLEGGELRVEQDERGPDLFFVEDDLLGFTVCRKSVSCAFSGPPSSMVSSSRSE